MSRSRAASNLIRGVFASKPPLAVGISATISIASGTGYIGSTYTTSDVGGQWYADNVAIPGETAANYVMTSANEGKQIKYRIGSFDSNKIKLWTPSVLATGNVLGWWDAYATSTITLSGANVSRWDSKTGSVYLQQATTANQPTYSATGRNSKPAVIANGTTQLMSFSDASTFPLGTNPSHVMMLAYHGPTGSSAWQGLVMYGNGTGSQARFLISKGPTNNVSLSNGSGEHTAGVTWLDKDRIVSSKIYATGSEIVVDGSTTTTSTLIQNTVAGTSNFLFNSTGTQYWAGSCQEFFILNRMLTTDERQRTEGYLAHKWGLTASLASDHPYKTTPPNGLSIAVTSGNGYFGSTYTSSQSDGQWYLDGVATGITSSTYAMTAQDEGKSVTYRTATATSNAIKLFVPSQLTGLTAWFDAADSTKITMDGSNVVSQWNSKVGTLYATNATAGARPTWSATGRNGQPAMVVSGSKTMFINAPDTLPIGTATAHHFGVAYSSATAYRQLFFQGSEATAASRIMFQLNTNVVATTTFGAANDLASSTAWSNSDRMVSILFQSGTSLALAVDGLIAPLTKTVSYSTPTGGIASFFSRPSGDYWQGSLSEYIIFNRALTTLERQQIEGYYATRWNLQTQLPAAHPYRIVAPTAV